VGIEINFYNNILLETNVFAILFQKSYNVIAKEHRECGDLLCYNRLLLRQLADRNDAVKE
jgi:hypothetical protein